MVGAKGEENLVDMQREGWETDGFREGLDG